MTSILNHLLSLLGVELHVAPSRRRWQRMTSMERRDALAQILKERP